MDQLSTNISFNNKNLLEMSSPKYTISRGPFTEQVDELNLSKAYLQKYKTNIEKQLAPFLTKIVEDEAEIELTVAPNGRDILYWKIVNWTAEGYDRLITSNVIWYEMSDVRRQLSAIRNQKSENGKRTITGLGVEVVF